MTFDEWWRKTYAEPFSRPTECKFYAEEAWDAALKHGVETKPEKEEAIDNLNRLMNRLSIERPVLHAAIMNTIKGNLI